MSGEKKELELISQDPSNFKHAIQNTSSKLHSIYTKRSFIFKGAGSKYSQKQIFRLGYIFKDTAI